MPPDFLWYYMELQLAKTENNNGESVGSDANED